MFFLGAVYFLRGVSIDGVLERLSLVWLYARRLQNIRFSA